MQLSIIDSEFKNVFIKDPEKQANRVADLAPGPSRRVAYSLTVQQNNLFNEMVESLKGTNQTEGAKILANFVLLAEYDDVKKYRAHLIDERFGRSNRLRPRALYNSYLREMELHAKLRKG